MPELVVHSLKQYEERAVELAKSPTAMQALKAKLAKKRMTAPLFDTSGWVRDWEVGLDEVSIHPPLQCKLPRELMPQSSR